MTSIASRESCDTVYQDVDVSAENGAEQDLHQAPGPGSQALETPYNAEWLSDLIGTQAFKRESKHTLRKQLGCERTGHLWNPELRKAFKRVAWDLLPELLQNSSPPWMHSIKLTRYTFGQLPQSMPWYFS